MQILKSLGDGIGTGAGVAWPTFGIVFGTLGLTIGPSITAVVLGSISAGLFVLVALPVTYWSYKNHLKESKKLQCGIEEQENQISELIVAYLLSLLKEYLFKNKRYANDVPTDCIKKKMAEDIMNGKCSDQVMPMLDALLHHEEINDILSELITLNNKNKITNNDNLNENSFSKKYREKIKDIYKKSSTCAFKPHRFSAQVKAGMVGFSAAFGSVAGCGAGTLGLLGSVGIFAGLAVTPIIGWVILGVAIVFGLVVSGVCIYSSSEKSKKYELIAYGESINSELKNMVLLRNTTLTAEIAAQKKYEPEPSIKKRRSYSVDLDRAPHQKYSLWNNSQRHDKQERPQSRPFKNSHR